MKKLLVLLAPLTLALSACVSTTGTTGGTTANATNNLAMMAVRVGIEAKCVTELNNNAYWKTASRVLNDAKKQELQTEVCSCVGDKATTSITTTDLVIAAMDKTTQANLASKIVAQTLNTCVIETFKQ